MARLAGRKIIITGGASGIGRATARLFRQEGAAVAILDRSDNAAKAVADEIGAVALACDVSDPASVSAAVNKAAEAMGGLDGVINAAGILAETGIADTTAEVFSRTVAVNLTGTFLVIQAAAPLIQKAGRGTIVNIASGVGLMPTGPGSVAYVASKGGVVALTKSVAMELAPNIRVNSVRPGAVETAMTAGYIRTPSGDPNPAITARYAIGRHAQPEELAAAILFLTSDESSFMTGIALPVEWAAGICGIPADEITALARRAAAQRALVTCSMSLQRAEYGEQPVWMAVVLAAMLGQIGLPGGGFAYALGATSNTGKPPLAVPLPTVPTGRNSIPDFIPVARIADMLLQPGEAFDYDGRRLAYPDIRLVYWAGGNPFHHHQDLGRLRRAFCRPDTVIVQESVWTATARHADIVLPATITLEREDIGGTAGDPLLVAMHQAVAPYGSARDDHAIFTGLADRLGFAPAFTEGRTVRQWLEHLYEPTRRALADRGVNAPSFAEFWEDGELVLPTLPWDGGPIREFRRDPDGAPLPTPSGRIEIVSQTIAGFGYADCPGHPTWMPPVEAATSPAVSRFSLQLIANQPATRLHSQLDFGATSLAAKVRGREPVRIHPRDAADRGIHDGDIVRIYSDRGACLAGAVLSDALRPGVVQLATGAWYDPEDPAAPAPFCVHGNPNVLTRDVGTSRLAQGCTGQVALVEIERFAGSLPAIKAFDPPPS